MAAKRNSGRYVDISFRLSESDYKYLGGLAVADGSPLALDKHLLKTILTLQFPVDIVAIQHKKYRGLDKYYYLVTIGLHKSDMEDLDYTITHEYPKSRGFPMNDKKMSQEDKYSLLFNDLLCCYTETLGEMRPYVRKDNLVQKVGELPEGIYMVGLCYRGPNAYVWEPAK